MKKSLIALLAFAIFTPSFGGAETLSEQVERLEKDVNDLQRQFYQGGNAVKGNLKSVPSSGNVDYLQIKMGEIEGQFAKITDDVEILSHNLEQLEQKVDRINADYEERFKTLEEAVAENKNALNEEKENVEKAASKPKVTAKDEYKAAYALMQNNDYVGAQKAFEIFLVNFPDDALAGNAQYWLAESFYARKDYAKAAVIFADGYQKYPKSAKAADNFLKLGLSMQAMGKKGEACTVFTSLAKEYPKAAENIKVRAKKEAGNLKCK